MKIALLGTGRIGGAVARRLSDSGYDMLLWNRSPDKAQKLGVGRLVPTPRQAVSEADLILSCLTDAEAVRAVFLGADGACEAAHGQTFVELSTAGTAVLEEVARELRPSGAELLDCPVLGTPPTVLRGEALLLLSGEQVRAEEVTTVLANVAPVWYVGPLGTASRLKLVSNWMVAVQAVAAGELLAASRLAGLDPETVFKLLERQAPGLATRRRHYVSREPQPVLFSLAGMEKDLQLATEAVGLDSQERPVTHAVREAVARAACVDPGCDLSAASDLQAGTT